MQKLISFLSAIEPNNSTQDIATIPLPLVVMTLFILFLLASSIFGWIAVSTLLWMKQPLPIRSERHATAPWGLLDIFVAIGAWLLCQIVGPIVFVVLGYRDLLLTEPTPLFVIAVVNGLCLFAVVAATSWIMGWFGRRADAVGWSLKRVFYDIGLGIVTFVLAAPLIYGLMGVATALSEKEYSHPLFEAFNDDPVNILYAFWVAVIVAPIVEEFLFRVLLQGFLQSLANGTRFSIRTVLLGRGRTEDMMEPPTDVGQEEAIVDDSRDMVRWADHHREGNPYGAPVLTIGSSVGKSPAKSDSTGNEADSASQRPGVPSRRPWWPVLVSGTLFGLAHFEYGVSWIPLILFGVVLGWLYRTTGRIWPSLAAHMFSNAIAIAGFSIQTFYAQNIPG